jgi:hypothetical protein
VLRSCAATLACSRVRAAISPSLPAAIGKKSQLIEFRDMLVAIRERVAALKKQGKSRDEVVTAKPTLNYDAKWGGFVISGDFFTRLVYAGV